ncbi:hypothetical protein OEZ85_000526 [Tetradesmus obliquus]|uniref:Chlorophyll synthase n=1 Tax=Tetradesmus obliquus TaxID=3088 RepID=A0ABY8UKT3_TETOB|nr:hypothetical protein OEZ85_000526 [Tetradesmus obliquus]
MKMAPAARQCTITQRAASQAAPAVLAFRLHQQQARRACIPKQQHMPLQQARKHVHRLTVHAALSGTSDGDDHYVSSSERLSTYLKLARIHNLVPSVILVIVGAWAGSGHRVSAVQSISVWLMGLISGGMAIASCVVNDYFDLKIDASNAPDKPLPSGAIAPDAALLLSSLLYCGCLIAACLMEPSRLRSIVAFSAAATLLYTPLFKRLTGVKNATVATVIALAPLAGALAAGAGDAGLLRLLPATLFAFSGVMFREILMDLNDAEGDRQAGVWTLPVLLGKPAALLCAASCALLGCGGALVRLLQSNVLLEQLVAPGGVAAVQQWLAGVGLGGVGVHAAGVLEGLAVGLPCAVLGVIATQLMRLALGVWREKFLEQEAVMFREILMDLNDAEGDRQAGVWTLPVLLGKPAALLCAASCALLGCGGALVRLLQSNVLLEQLVAPGGVAAVQQWLAGVGLGGFGVHAAAVLEGLAVGLPCAVIGVIATQLMRLALGVWREKFLEQEVGRAVGGCLKFVGWGILLLAAMG